MPFLTTILSLQRRRRMARHVGVLALAVAVSACGTEDGETLTGPEVQTDDTLAPSVASVSPADGATDVPVGSSIRVAFSEPIDPASVRLSALTLGSVSGIVSVSTAGLELDPGADLEYGTTYTASVGAAVSDTAGNAMGAPFTWSFTTEEAPAPPFALSITPGRLWAYDLAWSRTVVGAGIGVDEETFEGWALLAAEEATQWQGRSAWRLVRYDVEAVPGENAFSRRVVHLHEAPDGIDVWVDDAVGGRWRRILSIGASSFSNNHFLLAGDPRGPTTTMGVGQAAVPAGSFTTLRARVQHTVTGPYVPEDIFETRTEEWASGVGIVRASWDFSFDDNDPSAWDVFEGGLVELLPEGRGPAAWETESEPNDAPDAGGSQAFAYPLIVEGSVAVDDQGTVVSDPDVFPNVAGEARIQDWYRIVVPPGGMLVRIDLDFDRFSNGAFNDVDLYVMAQTASGLSFVGRSTAEPGEPESLSGSLAGGIYYLGVQAWNTPTGPVGYALSLR